MGRLKLESPVRICLDPDLVSSVTAMLDFITLVSTMGLQQELNEASRERKANLVLRDEEGEENGLVEQAADQLSSAFDSFENSLSQGLAFVFGSAPEGPACKKIP